MTIHLRVVMSIAVILYFFLIVRFIKKKTLALKYTLLWLFAGLGMAILVFVPDLLNWTAELLGIASPMNALFMVAIGFVIIILMSLTAIVSKQTERIKNLAQKNAMLEKRLREEEGNGYAE